MSSRILSRRWLGALAGAGQLLGAAVSLLWTASTGLARADADTDAVWELGVADGSSAEFRQWIDPQTGSRVNYADPSSDPVFRVGTSNPAQHWLAFQPGSSNGGAGFRAHPFTVEFHLEASELAKTAGYSLALNLLAYSARLPTIEVTVNGIRGVCYQAPELDYEAGDAGVFFLPYYSRCRILCPLPTNVFQAGLNRLVLVARDFPEERDDSRPSGFAWPGSSGVHYDSLRLARRRPSTALGSAESAAEIGVRVSPRIFFRNGDGAREDPRQLVEQVDVVVTSPNSMEGADIALEMEGWRGEGRLKGGTLFGEWKTEFWAPAWEGLTPARVSVSRGGKVLARVDRPMRAARRWTLHVAPHAHLDVGYTDHPAKVAEIQSRMLDRAMEWSRGTPEFRFTPDGFWCVEEYWKGRGDGARSRLIDAIKAGVIEVPVVHSSIFTGFASAENMVRGLYPAKAFSRRHGTPFDVALVTDVPSYSWAFASVLAASGVKSLAVASDAYRGPFLLWNRFHETSPHFWEGPDGGRILTWYSRHYHQLSSLFGMPPRWENGRDSLERFLQAYDHPGFPSDHVLVYGSQVENSELHPGQVRLIADWNRRYRYPHLEFSGFQSGLDAVVRHGRHAGDRPVVRGDGGPYWEDGLGADARTTAVCRENMSRILSAEKWSTIATLLKPEARPAAEKLDLAWENLRVMDEHTWHADCSVREPRAFQTLKQGELKPARALEARRQIEHVLSRALSVVCDSIPAAPGSLVVFNSLSWERGGWVEWDLNHGMGLVDLKSGASIPYEVLWTGNAFDRVRFFVPRVPALGYASYAIRPTARRMPSNDVLRDDSIEGPFYRVRLDRSAGRVASLVDRETGREWVDPTLPVDCNEVVYVTGGDELPNRLVQYSTVAPLPKLQAHRAAGPRHISAWRTPNGIRIRIEGSLTNVPAFRSEWFFPDAAKQIEIENRISKDLSYRKEALYFAFSFALKKPAFRYATQLGIVDPSRDLLPGACREWFLAHPWVEMSDENGSIAWVAVDAPLFSLGDIVRGTWPKEFGSRPGIVYSYAMNNYTPEGYLAGQGGEFVFRYRIRTSRGRDTLATQRFGQEALTPLEVNEVTRNDKIGAEPSSLPVSGHSFFQVRPSHVALSTWKRAETGDGTVVRLVNLTEQGGEAQIESSVGAPMVWARVCNALEDDLREARLDAGGVSVSVPPFGLGTVRVGNGTAK